MAVNSEDVVDALVTLLAGITVAGGYNYDLDGTDQVVIGRHADPPRHGVACVEVADARVVGSYDADLTSYRRTLTVVLVARGPASADTPAARMRTALRLLDDVITRMEGDYTIGGRVLSLIVTDSGPIEGLEGDALAMGACACTVEMYWFAARGVGV